MAVTQLRQGRQKRKGQSKGCNIDAQARGEIQALLDGKTLRRDCLIEYLHLIQDQYQCLSADHLNALAATMRLSAAEVYEVASFYHHFDIVGEGESAPPKLTLRVCDSMTCAMFGAEALISKLEQVLGSDVRVQRVPCVGRCETAPVAVVGTLPISKATSTTVEKAVAENRSQAMAESYTGYRDYLKQGGYQTLQLCLDGTLDTESVITTLEDSGLRGLGGAGFPVGRKWRIVRAQAAPRLMAVNIDEGEPGTIKDRYYLERDPHRFLEGTLIAAHVVGIDEIYIYLRDEYAGIRAILQQELDTLQQQTSLPLPPIQLRRGAGAYICGEESAMIESIEGKRGMPRLRPPFVAEVGLFGCPTLEHNMESLYWIRDILEKGASWFTSEGRHGRKGLRSFSVSGRVNKPGVHLAPAGITVRELIDEYCGGMLDGHQFYGYFPGGASGGILPASMSDIPLDFDTLNEYGCFIGSAAVIIFSDQDRARDLALNAMRFFKHESCGQCTPCRVGTTKAVHLAPAGITVRELIDEYCGGMLDGHQFYGYFPGGASGGILPASMSDIPLDFDTLNEYGCFIGSAAVIIFSDQDRARDLALNAMRFFKHESCGQCTPCRVGTTKAVHLMKQKVWSQTLMNELADVMMDASICGLGQAAPNPMQCVMKYFPEEVSNGS